MILEYGEPAWAIESHLAADSLPLGPKDKYGDPRMVRVFFMEGTHFLLAPRHGTDATGRKKMEGRTERSGSGESI